MTTVNSEVKKTLNALGERRVISTYSSGQSWYRVWSDGWIEQGGAKNLGTVSGSNGGITTISLIKVFATTNYSVKFTVSSTDADVKGGPEQLLHDRYTNRFEFGYWNRNNSTTIPNYTVIWTASGY